MIVMILLGMNLFDAEEEEERKEGRKEGRKDQFDFRPKISLPGSLGFRNTVTQT